MLKKLRSCGKFLSLFLLCLAMTVACNNNQAANPDNTTSTTNRIAYGTSLKPRTLDPADSYEIVGLNMIYNLGDTLYSYELGTTNLVPQLATAMPTISEDGLTYTIPLREGVTFHDGTPFNAEAMAFSLQRFITNGGKPSFLLADTIDSLEATGEYELTVKLKQPFAAFTSLLAFAGACAVSPQAYEIGAGSFNPNQFVGTGPYKLAESGSDSLRLDVFADYWGEKPENEGVDVQLYSGSSANLFNGFRTGAVDLAYQSLEPDQIKSLLQGAQEGQWQVIEAPGTAVNYLVLNRQQEPLDKVEVRQAIAALIDRELINNRVLQGQGEPAYSLIPSAFASSQPKFKELYGDGNMEKAKQLLSEAGYSPSNPAVIEIWYPSSSMTRSLVASTLKALADKELEGAVKFEPKSVEGATFFAKIKEGLYPAALANWYPDFLDADNYTHPLVYCSQGSSSGGCEQGSAQNQGSFYYSDRINKLIDEQRQAKNPEAREQIFAEIQKTLAEDVPYIPLWLNKEYAFAQNSVTGVKMNPSQNIPFWKISKN